MLEAQAIDLHYGESQILHKVDFSAQPGEVACLMGPNGVGKTSLLKAIVGHHPISGGIVRWDGTDISGQSAFQRARGGIAYVPQGREIFPLLSVEENLRTGFACIAGGEQRRAIPDFVYELFPVLKETLGRRGGDLSGGQQQQLAIARALITRPRLLVLDEPTEGIQPNIIQQIGRVIETLKASGEMAILLVEQYFQFANALADHITVMRKGEVVLAGRKGELADDDVKGLITI